MIDENTKNIKICGILQSDFPPDVRFSREARFLLAQDFQVHLLCNNKQNMPNEERYQGMYVHRLRYYRGILTKLGRMINTPIFFNPIWFFRLFKLFRTYHFQILHVVNLPLAPLALIFGRIFQIPVVYDMYENYPEAIRSWQIRGLRKLVRNPWTALILDKICMKNADAVIVVVREAKDRLIQLDLDPNKIYEIGNTVDTQTFYSFDISEEIIEKYKNIYAITYTGQFSAERGIETAIKAMPRIIDKIPNARLILVGSGPHHDNLVNLVKKENLENQVEFVGWIDYNLFPSFIKASRICIIPQPSNPFIDTTMPNKLFEYMAMGKPVLVSDAKPLARVVNECRCGEIFKSNSPKDFAEAIFRINQSTTDYANHGKKAVIEKYNWQASAKELARLYNEISKNL